jgi:hypothetical protein
MQNGANLVLYSGTGHEIKMTAVMIKSASGSISERAHDVKSAPNLSSQH